MLPRVANHENPIVGIELVQEGPHLPRAGKARFIEHVKMFGLGIGGCGCRPAATRKEALERRRVDSGLAELPRSLRGRSEALDRIAALFGALADAREYVVFPVPASPCKP